MDKNLYEILGVNESSTQEDIKKAFRQLAIKYHPDKHTKSEDYKEKEEKFKEISAAYQVLSDPKLKQEYDYKLKYEQNGGNFNFNDIFKLRKNKCQINWHLFFNKRANDYIV